MNRSRSAGPFPVASVEDIRGVCKKISPYIVHQWRDVCEELGVPDEALDHLEAETDKNGGKKSEVAFQGLALWFEKVGRAANKDKLMRIIQLLGLRRAEDELRQISQKNTINAIARPVTAASQVSQPSDFKLSKQAKQKAAIDRLARPKALTTEPETHKLHVAVPGKKKPVGDAPPGRQINKNELCEVKVKITVSGVQRSHQTEVQSTRDVYQSTKNDYKHTCHTFVKLVMAKRNEHFSALKSLLGFSGISMQRMNHMGFNIICFILCSNLGSFEVLYQAYKSGRLKRICQTVFVTPECLKKLDAVHVDLSVTMEDAMVNEYRDILLLRGVGEHPEKVHPADDLKLPQKIISLVQSKIPDKRDGDELLDLKMWQKTLREDTDTINYRFQRFNENALEFLRTLRIVKPDEIKPVSSLNDIISCLNFLRNSQSLASGVRVDLVREFIAIVNQVRLKFEEIREKEISVSFDIKLSSDGCELFHDYLEKLEVMLEPSYIFESNETLLTHSLSVLEKELFTGLLSYIPSLLSVLFSLNESLTCLRTEEEIDKLLNYDENATKEEEDNENDSGQGEEMKSE